MAVHQLTITLTGSAQPLSSTTNPSINARWASIESETGNSAVAVGTSVVTATSYGSQVLAGPAARLILNPSDGNLCIGLNTTYVIGTANQVIHVLYIL